METSSLQILYGFKDGHNFPSSSKWTAHYSLFPPNSITETQPAQALNNGKILKYLCTKKSKENLKLTVFRHQSHRSYHAIYQLLLGNAIPTTLY